MLPNSNNKFHTKIADLIFNESPVAILIIDSNGVIKNANKCASSLLAKNDDLLLSKSIFDLIPKIQVLFPTSWWQKVLNKNNELVTQVFDSKGNKLRVKVTAQLNVDQGLHLLYLLPESNSIPETAGFLKSEDKLAAYFNSTSELIALVNPQKLIISYNKIFEQYVQMVLGKSVVEGEPMINYIIPDFHAEFLKHFEIAFHGKEVKIEREIKYLELNIWWAITYLPIRNEFDEILGVAFVLQNIDDKKIAEEALVKSEERFKLVIEGSNEGWWDWDFTNNSLFYSPKWWHTLGYQNNELINIVNFWQKIVHSDDLENVQTIFNNVILDKNVSKYQIEYRAKHKDGFYIPMLSRGFVKRDENGIATRVTGSDMDLRERKQFENLLLENQRKLQIAQKIALVGNYEIDLVNLKWSGSQIIQTIFGIDFDSVNSFKSLLKLVHPDYLKKVIKCYHKAISFKTPFNCEYKIVQPDSGIEKWVSDFSDIDFDEFGKPVRIIGSIQDISNRKISEESLNQSELKYRSLMENMDLGILEVDNNEIIMKAYPKFCQMLGYTEDELLGKNAAEIFLPKFELDNFLNSINAREMGLSNAYEVQLYNKNKEIVNVIISGTPTYNESGEVIGSIGIHYNISGRKKIEQELKESNKTFETLFKVSPAPLIITEPNTGKIILANDAFLTLTKHNFQEIIDKSSADIIYNQEQRLEIFNKLSKNKSIKDLELIIFDSLKNPINCLLSAEVIDFKGSKVHLKSFIDITERIRSEQELTNSLNLVTDQNKRLLNFSYIVSHNLRSHTSNIKSIVGFLNGDLEHDERIELTNHLTNVSDMLDETLNNLNEVLSIQKNVNITVEKINLGFFIDKSLSILNEQIQQNNIQIISNFNHQLSVNFNAAYLESIIYNLISNAIKYSKKDNKQQSFIQISTKIINNKICLSIIDNGIGIDLIKNKDKLFGMYKTFHDNEDARGIGLFITKNQIEAMGGTIDVFSELGLGTTFKITFK